MKRRVIAVLLIVVLLSSVCSACGRKEENRDQAADAGDTAETDTEDHSAESTGTEAAMDTENVTSQLQLGSAVEIPASFDGQLAETDAHGQLEMVIAEYCGLAEDDYSAVRYYYNYVDLNGDSRDEILALVLGQDIAGVDGNLLLWLEGDEDSVTADAVLQEFRQVGTPVYISSHMTNGYRDLILTEHLEAVGAMAGASDAGSDAEADGTSGAGTAGMSDERNDVEADGTSGAGSSAEPAGTSDEGNDVEADGTSGAGSSAGTAGMSDRSAAAGNETADSDEGIPITTALGQQYRLLRWTGEKYQELEEGSVLESLDELEGIAVLTNNIESDFINDNYHFLGEGMRE